MEAFLRGDPTRDNILHPVPLQDRPYLFRVDCVPGRFGTPKHFYVWGTRHDFPIQATLHPSMLRQLLSSCNHIIGESKSEKLNNTAIYARIIQMFRERGLMLEGAAKEAFITQLAAEPISFLTDYDWSTFKDSKIEEEADTHVKGIPSSLSAPTTLSMRNLFIEKKKRELQLEREFILDSVRIQVDSWAECLPPYAKARILHLLGKDFDLNTLHPTIVSYLCRNGLRDFRDQRGLDSMIKQYFLWLGGGLENMAGLETTQNKMDNGILDDLANQCARETLYGFQHKIKQLSEMKKKPDLADASNHVFRWDSVNIGYHKGIERISEENRVSTAGRDRAWVPVYMPRIQEYVENRSSRPFLMFVGGAHLYYMLATLAQRPSLIKGITRYDATRGWVPIAFKSDEKGRYLDYAY